jgi:hypothetical protein
MNKYLIILAIFLFTGCSSLKVSYDMDKNTDFTKFESYSLLPWNPEMNKIVNDLDRRRLQDAIKKEFNSRGLEYKESGGDIAVSIYIVVEQKTSVTAYNNYYGGYGMGYRYGGWGWGMGYGTTTYQESDYLVGTGIIDVFDDESKELVWQGIGTGTVNENPNDREERIERSIGKILYNFPIKKVNE